MLSEGGAEVALIIKASSERDFGESDAFVLHECQSVTHAASAPIFSGRAAKVLSKCSSEIDRMHSELVRHLGDRQRITAPIVEEFPRLSNPWWNGRLMFIWPEADARKG